LERAVLAETLGAFSDDARRRAETLLPGRAKTRSFCVYMIKRHNRGAGTG